MQNMKKCQLFANYFMQNVGNFVFGAVQKCVYLVDLVKSVPTSIYYLLAKFGVDTAENEPSKISNFIPT